jgi:hypothetical protein
VNFIHTWACGGWELIGTFSLSIPQPYNRILGEVYGDDKLEHNEFRGEGSILTWAQRLV